MKTFDAKRSTEINIKTKQSLVAQSIFMQKNASIYLDLQKIPLNGNGSITTTHSRLLSIPKKIQFSHLDSVEAAIQSHNKTGILVSCSHRRAGGGWLSGSVAQEESISRATTWATQAGLTEFSTWYQDNSWLGQKGSLILDGLLIFNQNQEELIEPKPVVFAGIAAANKASLNNDIYWGSNLGTKERQHHLVLNLACAFEALASRGVDDVILCVFGTNVFGWTLQESISVLHEATRYASPQLNFICAMASEERSILAEDVYSILLK